jgi:Dna[CI] antecedent, DciA
MAGPSRLDRYIASDPVLETLAVEAERLRRLQSVFRTTVPGSLAASSRVAAFERGTVVVFADNSATAAKLNQLTARITLHLSSELPEVTGTKVEVQVEGRSAPTQGRQKPLRRFVSQEELAPMKDLHEKMPDSPLKSAIGKFLTHRKKS